MRDHRLCERVIADPRVLVCCSNRRQQQRILHCSALIDYVLAAEKRGH